MMSRANSRKRVLSGMRSTGKLHLGNYVGALDNWVRMQDQYECFFFIADWHALTTDYADTSKIKENSVEVLMDWLAAGLDPVAECAGNIDSVLAMKRVVARLRAGTALDEAIQRQDAVASQRIVQQAIFGF